MRKLALVTLLALSFISQASAQLANYTSSFSSNAGNPGNLNAENDQDVAGWSTVFPANQSSNSWGALQNLPAGFAFNFFGLPVTGYRVSGNGLLTFTTVGAAPPPSPNASLPSALLANNTIAAFWQSFVGTPPTSANSIVNIKEFGTAPNRQLWIRWRQFMIGSPVISFVNFAIVLEETTDKIYVVDYKVRGTGTTSTTVGVQFNSSVAHQYGSSVPMANNSSSAFTDNDYITFTPFPILPFNAAMGRFVSPATGCGLGANTPVTVVVKNVGSNNVVNPGVTYVLNNGTPVSETFTATIPANDSAVLTFSTPVNLSAPGTYTLSSWVTATNDNFAANDTTKNYQIRSVAKLGTAPMTFETEGINPNALRDSFHVQLGSLASTSIIQAAANTGFYGYQLAALNTSATGWVTPTASPANEWTINSDYSARLNFCFDATSVGALRLRFDRRQRAGFNLLNSNLRILVNGVQVGNTYRPLTTTADPFVTELIDITPFVGGPITVTFEARCRTSNADLVQLDNITFVVPPNVDLGVMGLFQPQAGICVEEQLPVSLIVKNDGAQAQSNIPLTVRVLPMNVVLNLTYPGPILPSEVDTILLGNVNALNQSTLSFKAWHSKPGDGVLNNDTLNTSRQYRARPMPPISWKDTTICGPVSAVLNLPDKSLTYYWWDDSTTATKFHTGSMYQTGVLNTTTSYFISAQQVKRTHLGPKDRFVGNGLFNSNLGTQEGMRFNVLNTCQLDSVRIYPQTAGYFFIRLRDPSGALVQTTPILLPNPVADTVVYLGYPLGPGTGYILEAFDLNCGGLFYNSSGISYPYTLPGVLSITGPYGGSTNVFKYFYDWVIGESSCEGYRQRVTLHIPLKPSIPLPKDTLACEPFFLDAGNPGSTYLWNNGQTSRTRFAGISGTYAVTVTTVDGCSTTDSVKITVQPTPSADIVPDTIRACGFAKIKIAPSVNARYLWSNGSKTTEAYITQTSKVFVTVTDTCGTEASDTVNVEVSQGALFDLGGDTILCNNNIVMLDATVPGFLYNWSTGVTTPQIVVSSPGKYWVDVFKPGGCAASDTVNVAYESSPTVELGPNRTVCGFTTIDAGPQPAGYTYQWSTGASTRSISVGQTGRYEVNVYSLAGCMSTDSVRITVAAPFSVNLGPDAAVCNSFYNLNAGNAGKTHLWSTGATDTAIVAIASGTYWVRVTDANGCVVTDTVRVVLNPAPALELGPDTNACGPIVLDAGNPVASYLWSTGATTQRITVTSGGNYSVTVTYPCGGVVSDNINVTFFTPPAAPLASFIEGCDSKVLDASSPGASYLWSTGATTASINATESGVYWVQITGPGGCTTRDTASVLINPTPTATIALPDTYYVDASLWPQAIPTPYALGYSWNFGADALPAGSTEERPVILKYTTEGIKTVRVTVSNGVCSSTVSRTIVIVEQPVFPPDAADQLLDSRFTTLLYPNPSSGSVNLRVDLPLSAQLNLSLSDALGRRVRHWSMNHASGQGDYSLDLDNVASGLYHFQLHTPAGSRSLRLLVR